MSQNGAPPSKISSLAPGKPFQHSNSRENSLPVANSALPSLNSWPCDILSYITAYLPFNFILKLKECGDTALWSRIEQEPIIKDAIIVAKPLQPALELLGQCRQLCSLHIELSSYIEFDVDHSWILDLPPRLESLNLEFENAMMSPLWLCPTLPGEAHWTLTNPDGMRPIYLCAVLPRLRRLRLATTRLGFMDREESDNIITPAMECLFLKKLPPGLSDLEMDMTSWTPDMIRMLPANLTRLASPVRTINSTFCIADSTYTIFSDEESMVRSVDRPLLPPDLFNNLTHLDWHAKSLGVVLTPAMKKLLETPENRLPYSMVATDPMEFTNLQHLDLCDVDVFPETLHHLPRTLKSLAFSCAIRTWITQEGVHFGAKERRGTKTIGKIGTAPVSESDLVYLPQSLEALVIWRLEASYSQVERYDEVEEDECQQDAADGEAENDLDADAFETEPMEKGENGAVDTGDETMESGENEPQGMGEEENAAMDQTDAPYPLESDGDPNFCSFLPPNLTSLSLYDLDSNWDLAYAFRAVRTRLPKLTALSLRAPSCNLYDLSWIPTTTLSTLTLQCDAFDNDLFNTWPQIPRAQNQSEIEIPRGYPPLALNLDQDTAIKLTNEVGRLLPPNLTSLRLQNVQQGLFGPDFLRHAPRTLISFAIVARATFSMKGQPDYWEDTDILALSSTQGQEDKRSGPPHLQHLNVPTYLVSFDECLDMKRVSLPDIHQWRTTHTNPLATLELAWHLPLNPSFPSTVTAIDLPIRVDPLSTIWNMSKLESLRIDQLRLSSERYSSHSKGKANLSWIPFTDPAPGSRPSLKRLCITGNEPPSHQWFEWRPMKSLTTLELRWNGEASETSFSSCLSNLPHLTRLLIRWCPRPLTPSEMIPIFGHLPPGLTWLEMTCPRRHPFPALLGADRFRLLYSHLVKLPLSHCHIGFLAIDFESLACMPPSLTHIRFSYLVLTLSELTKAVDRLPKETTDISALSIVQVIAPSVQRFATPEEPFDLEELLPLFTDVTPARDIIFIPTFITNEDGDGKNGLLSLTRALPSTLETWICPVMPFSLRLLSSLPSGLTALDLSQASLVDIEDAEMPPMGLTDLRLPRGDSRIWNLQAWISSLPLLHLELHTAGAHADAFTASLPRVLKALIAPKVSVTRAKSWPPCLEKLALRSIDQASVHCLPLSLTSLAVPAHPDHDQEDQDDQGVQERLPPPPPLLLPSGLDRLTAFPGNFYTALGWEDASERLSFKNSIRSALDRA